MKDLLDSFSPNIFQKKMNHYIKDPVHKEINFYNDKWLLDFVYSYEMVRLLEIKQLGTSFKTFPSATNNRYSHCLGAFCVAQKFAKHFIAQISKPDRKLFLIAALLHDIGHGPYSHVFEKISHLNHEEMGWKIIKNENLKIYHLLKKNKINIDNLINVYSGKCEKNWIGRLISSNLDVDRIDYLLRDSYFVGTNFSTIDVNFLIERSFLINNDVYFSSTAANYIESFLLGRYYMHQDIYDNKNTYAYEWCLIKIFERLKEIKDTFSNYKNQIYFYDFYEWIVFEKEVSVDKIYIHLNDSNLNSFLVSLKVMEDKILNSFVEAFFNIDQIFVFSYTKELLDEVKKNANNKNIDISYLFTLFEKPQKSIYLSEEKNSINIFNANKKLTYKFSAKRLSSFNQNATENNKIIMINKNLIS
ncbi:MAG: HD domain-containing protein [Malacoplasma sp.]|nr:HD domain-containing protein [Malacoplasma sp.]